MRGIKHKVKLFFIKVHWVWKVWFWAMIHHKQVRDYRFLLETKKAAKAELLKTQKMENALSKEKAHKLKIQLELLDKIINYVSK